MSNYRIIRYVNPFYTTFKVQKQSFFGFWYNFNSIDGCTTGYYDTADQAREAIDRHRGKTISTILNVEPPTA